MIKDFVTIRVYKADRETLNAFGTTTHEALRSVLIKECPHPEDLRVYVTAIVDYPSAKMKTKPAKMKTKPIGGFFCVRCGKYMFTAAKA